MSPDLSARCTGKTTRVLLSAALAMSRGERVVIVTATAQQARSLHRSLCTLLEQLGADPFVQSSRYDIMCWDGFTRITPADSLMYSIKGCTFNTALVDGGVLDAEEERELRQRVPVDVHHFPTEYEEVDFELDLNELDPKDSRRAPRTLSSRCGS